MRVKTCFPIIHYISNGVVPAEAAKAASDEIGSEACSTIQGWRLV